MSDRVMLEDGRLWWDSNGQRQVESDDDFCRRTGRQVRNLTVPRGTLTRSDVRPAHVHQAMVTLLGVAFTHPSTITGLELLEVSHYVARLERRLAELERPNESIVDRMLAWWDSL